MDEFEKARRAEIEQMFAEAEGSIKRIESAQEVALQDVVRYFDRINDKLFSYNNILLAGYLAVIAFIKINNWWLVLIPIVNMLLLVGVDYKMLSGKKKIADPNSTLKIISQANRDVMQSNALVVLTVFSTLIVTAVFIWVLFTIEFKPS